MKKTAGLFALVMILLLLALPAGAVEPADAQSAAAALAELGLFQGDGQGFALDEPCNRLHGAVLFTRLLGQEEEALTHHRPHPFLDISQESWVAPYLGYLYNHGLAYGLASDHYGAGQMQPAHFATFCLRALGYTEGSELSDFKWTEALDFMVERGIISGSLRNTLRSSPLFTRGDAALLSHATLNAETAAGGQTLLQKLTAAGVISLAQAQSFGGIQTDFNIAYPQGLLSDEVLARLAQENGITLGSTPYASGAAGEEQLYRELRQPGVDYDICVVPGYLVERLSQDGLLRLLYISEFGGREAIVPSLRDNPYWRDEATGNYYALPLAFELPLLYYNSARVQDPDWSWLFRDVYAGGVYMPEDSAALLPLALHYYGYAYDKPAERQLLEAVQLLQGQAAAVPAYLNEHMLDIAEKPEAIFGVISSRELPELEQRREQNQAYANWQVKLPPAGGPVTVYYAVILQNADRRIATNFLRGLLQPELAAANAQDSGYLPSSQAAGSLLTGAFAEAWPGLRWGRCRLLNLDETGRAFYEQTRLNVLLEEAKQAAPPDLATLEFYFTREDQVWRACRVDLAALSSAAWWKSAEQTEPDFSQTRPLTEARVKTFRKEAARLGLSLWKEYYDGPDSGPGWQLKLSFADGTEKSCGGYGLPPVWQEMAGALAALCGEEAIPPTL